MNAPLRFSLSDNLHVRISEEQIPGYEHSISFGNQTLSKWDTGSMLEQTVIQKGFGFCLLNFSISQYTILTVESLQNFNTIQYTLKGNASCVLTGHGIVSLCEKTYTPMYIPQGIHFVGFEPDVYTFLYIILSQDHLSLLSEDHSHLETLIQKTLTSSKEGMLLERMAINQSVNRLIKKLETLKLTGTSLSLKLQEIALQFISIYNDDINRKKNNELKLNAEGLADQIKIYVIENLFYPNKLNIDNLSIQFHTTKRTIERHFKRKFNQPLKSFIQNMRLDRALHMLLLQQKSVSVVSEDLGYADVKAFRNQFVKRYGYAPKFVREHFNRPSKQISVTI